ncbi:methyladenine glycosylase family protein [Asticcacaulis biprosthecium C19]|uniref:Methyladenine glycosylase family protein n=1 Tax=Asticcacaulis biprosthecium C19 TaxID=715226 RepID=F4QMX5_9CAUL|nr:DNA-3-methyladenine glycosylase I [Asticcacaulis biprosthecium]EGF91566.1 methyladenine glycosylase family protein [Asticcacaulis biprosthecium C19]
MIRFAEIEARAAERKGGAEALEALLITPKSMDEIAAIPEDRWLSQFTRCIFEAGFNWDLIEKRWPQFEDAFDGFDVTRWLFMSDEDLSALMKAPGLVANAMKIRSVAGNAQYLSDVATSHGSAGAYFASWPVDRYMELCGELKNRGSRLGGATGQRALRRMGRDALLLSPSVIKALNHWAVVSGEPTSKKDIAAVQSAISAWHEDGGRGLTQMSQILAYCVD